MEDKTSLRLEENRHQIFRKAVLGVIFVLVILVAALMIETHISGVIKDFTVKKSSITDEKATFIPLKQLDTDIIAVKASDGTYRLAFNDCTRCYYQEGKHKRFTNNNSEDGLVCENCGCEIKYDDIGFVTEEGTPYPIAESEIISDKENFTLTADYLKNKKLILESWRNGSIKGKVEDLTDRNSKNN